MALLQHAGNAENRSARMQGHVPAVEHRHPPRRKQRASEDERRMSTATVIMRAMVVAVAWLFVGTAHAAYKCVGPDGRVVYTDTPCATDTKQSEVRGTQQRASGQGRKRETLKDAPSEEQVRRCVEAWRPSMRDPQSLYSQGAVMQLVTNRERPDMQPWREIVLDARSKNGFGGYNAIQLHCPLNGQDGIDQKTLDAYKALRTLGIEID